MVHNHDNDYLDWLSHQNVFPLRGSTSIMSGNGKGFTLRELLKSLFTELLTKFPFQFHQKRFQSLVDGLLNFLFAFEL